MHNYCNGTVTVTKNHTYCIQSFVKDKQGGSNTNQKQQNKKLPIKRNFLFFLLTCGVCLKPTYTLRLAIRYEGTRLWRVLWFMPLFLAVRGREVYEVGSLFPRPCVENTVLRNNTQGSAKRDTPRNVTLLNNSQILLGHTHILTMAKTDWDA